MYKIRKYFIGIFILLSFFFSCNRKNKHAEKIFIQVESIIEQNPDSALKLLKSIEFPEELSSENYADYLLLYVQAKDKSGLNIVEDTLIHIPTTHFLQKKNTPKTALSYFYSGRVNFQQENNEKAIKDFLLAKDYAEKSKNYNLLGLIQYDLGYLYEEEDLNFELALYYYQQSRDCFLKADNEKNAFYALRLIGDIYLMQEPQQVELAFDIYNQVLQYAEQHKDSSLQIQTFKSIGVAYKEINNYPRAKEFLFKSIAIDRYKEYSSANYGILSDIYLSLNLPDSAIYCAEQLSSSVIDNKDYTDLYNYYDLLGSIYTKISKHEQASACYQKKSNFLDLLYKQKSKQSVLDIQEKYESEKLKNSLQKTELRKQFLLIIALSVALGATLLTGFLLATIRKKREKIQQVEQNLETMREMLKYYDENKHSLKHVLLEQLDVARKIAQLHTIPSDAKNFNETYFKIFGKNTTEKLDWDYLYPVIDKLYDGFVKKLRKRYSDLSEKNIQLCCLLRADFKIDEITFIQGYNNISSTQTQKSRLRIKLGFSSMKELLFFLENM